MGASFGSFGAAFHDGSEFTGNYANDTTPEEFKNYYRHKITSLITNNIDRRKIDLLWKSGVDLLAFETIPCKKEAEVLVDLLASEFPQSPCWISFSCRDEKHTVQKSIQ